MTPDPRPRVTVLMPVRNEAPFIERSLGAVLAQTFPPDRLDVLVIDGASDDGTQAQVHALAARHPAHRVTVLDNPARVVPQALNLGLQHTHSEVIVRVDGHCEIPPDYLRRCLALLAETGAEAVGGVLQTVGETYLARAIARAQSHPFGVGGAAFRTGTGAGRFVDTLAFGAYRRDVFARLGGFDEELVRNQDDEFNFRLTQSGGRLWLDPSLVVRYYSRAGLGALWRQYFDYGWYKVRVMQKRGGVASWRHLVPALLVAGLALALGLTLATGTAGWLMAALAVYGAAVLGASLHAAWTSWAVLPVLPLAFAVLHLAYGLGTWAGLWRWRRHFFAEVPSETA